MTRKMKDSGVEWIGEIPEDWEKKKLKNVAQFKNGLAHEKNIDMDGKYIVVNSKFVSTEGRVKIYSNELIMKLNLNDVCIVMSDVPNGKAFAKCYIIEQDNKYTLNQRIGCFYDININLRYFYYYLNRNNGLLLFDDGINQTNLRKPDLLNLIFLIPSPKEQERIANYLDKKCNKIDQTIEKEKQVIEKLKEYKQSVITEAVTKGLNADVKMKDSGVEWIGEIPEHWQVLRGKNILTLLKRPVQDGDEVITCFRDGQVTLRSNRREEGFTFSDKEIGYQGILKGDLVIHGMDGFAGAIGISDSDGKGSPVLNVCLPKKNSFVIYIQYYLRMLASQNVFLALATGIRERSCDLRWNKIANLEFVVPPISEQQEVANYLDKKCASIDKLILTKEKVIEKLTEYKKSLIYECVTGKKEVK